jgi:hypothetical protein
MSCLARQNLRNISGFAMAYCNGCACGVRGVLQSVPLILVAPCRR